MEAKKNDFGWLLSVIAILLTGLIGLEGILLHFISRSEQSDVRLASILFLVALRVVPTLIVRIRFNGYDVVGYYKYPGSLPFEKAEPVLRHQTS